jgi:hypothetical protein
MAGEYRFRQVFPLIKRFEISRRRQNLSQFPSAILLGDLRVSTDGYLDAEEGIRTLNKNQIFGGITAPFREADDIHKEMIAYLGTNGVGCSTVTKYLAPGRSHPKLRTRQFRRNSRWLMRQF